jgi:dTDP-4-amino-4,6-dideoxygalactose transaminase
VLTVLRKTARCWTSELRCSTGRSAVALFAEVSNRRCVLLPAICPDGLYDPFAAAGWAIKFYDLTFDLAPDMELIKSLIVDRPDTVIVVIHFFGREYNTTGIAKRSDDILFESCAHNLRLKAPNADVALWSFNKTLPVFDGAILKSRCDINVDVKEPHPYPNARALDYYETHLNAVARDDDELIVKAYEDYYKLIALDFTVREWSRRTQVMMSDLDWLVKECDAREENAKLYEHYFRGILKGGAFAWPYLCHKPRKGIANALRKNGVRAVWWGSHWLFQPQMKEFRERHILLPVGSEVTEKDIKIIAETIRSAEEK